MAATWSIGLAWVDVLRKLETMCDFPFISCELHSHPLLSSSTGKTKPKRRYFSRSARANTVVVNSGTTGFPTERNEKGRLSRSAPLCRSSSQWRYNQLSRFSQRHQTPFCSKRSEPIDYNPSQNSRLRVWMYNERGTHFVCAPESSLLFRPIHPGKAGYNLNRKNLWSAFTKHATGCCQLRICTRPTPPSALPLPMLAQNAINLQWSEGERYALAPFTLQHSARFTREKIPTYVQETRGRPTASKDRCCSRKKILRIIFTSSTKYKTTPTRPPRHPNRHTSNMHDKNNNRLDCK